MSRYIWRTQMDDRVRESHAALEGLEFEDGVGLEPGQDYNCRCYKEPIEDDELGFDLGIDDMFGFDETFGPEFSDFAGTFGGAALSSAGFSIGSNIVSNIISSKIPSKYGGIKTGSSSKLTRSLSKISKVFGKAAPYVALATTVYRAVTYIVKGASVSEIVSAEVGHLIGAGIGGKVSSSLGIAGSVFKSAKATAINPTTVTTGGSTFTSNKNRTINFNIPNAALQAIKTVPKVPGTAPSQGALDFKKRLADQINKSYQPSKLTTNKANQLGFNYDVGIKGNVFSSTPRTSNPTNGINFNFPPPGKIF